MATLLNPFVKEIFGAFLRDTDINQNKASQDLLVGRRLSKLRIDNTAGSNALCYLKFWDKESGSVTVGTTDPNYIFEIPAAFNEAIYIDSWDADGNILGGALFENGFTYACVTTPGTAGTTVPASAVIVEMSFR